MAFLHQILKCHAFFLKVLVHEREHMCVVGCVFKKEVGGIAFIFVLVFNFLFIYVLRFYLFYSVQHFGFHFFFAENAIQIKFD